MLQTIATPLMMRMMMMMMLIQVSITSVSRQFSAIFRRRVPASCPSPLESFRQRLRRSMLRSMYDLDTVSFITNQLILSVITIRIIISSPSRRQWAYRLLHYEHRCSNFHSAKTKACGINNRSCDEAPFCFGD